MRREFVVSLFAMVIALGALTVPPSAVGAPDPGWGTPLPFEFTVGAVGEPEVAVDAEGNVYVAWDTASVDFPITAGAFDTTYAGATEGYVAKFNANLSALVWATFLGGSGRDRLTAINVDSGGFVYVAGYTDSPDFPTTPGAFDRTLQSATCAGGNTKYPCTDGFVAKLNPSGDALVYSTLFGGRKWERTSDLMLDESGSLYVTGETDSSDFPTTAGAFSRKITGVMDAFIMKVNPTGSALVYSTYLGGAKDDRGYGIAVEPSGQAYVTGVTGLGGKPGANNFPTTPGAFDRSPGEIDAFVTKLNPTGGSLVYSTYLGGTRVGIMSGEWGREIAVDATGSAYVVGNTGSPDFPTTPGAFDTVLSTPPYQTPDAFVSKLNPSGSALVYSTFLGGAGIEYGQGIALSGNGTVTVAGQTDSLDFPVHGEPPADDLYNNTDAFLTRLDPTGSALFYSTYLGGSDQEYGAAVAMDAAGFTTVLGWTLSDDFYVDANAWDPTYNGGFDHFLSKFEP